MIFAEPIRPVVIPQSSLMQTALPVTEEDEVAAVERLIQTTEDQLRMQQHLKDLGQFDRDITGTYGAATRDALAKLQANPERLLG